MFFPAIFGFCRLWNLRQAFSEDNTETKLIRPLVMQWKSEYGERVDFDNKILQVAMTFASPPAKSQRIDIVDGNFIVDPDLVRFHLHEMKRLWFQDHVFVEKTTQPKQFALRRAPLESNLCYSWTTQDVRMDISESSEGLFVELRHPKWNMKHGISGRAVALQLDAIMRWSSKKKTPTQVMYKIPDLVREGDIFSSVEVSNHFFFWNAWENVLTGFVGRDALYLVVLRPPGKDFRGHDVGPLSQFEKAPAHNPGWLNGCIRNKEGKPVTGPMQGGLGER